MNRDETIIKFIQFLEYNRVCYKFFEEVGLYQYQSKLALSLSKIFTEPPTSWIVKGFSWDESKTPTSHWIALDRKWCKLLKGLKHE